MKVAIVGGDRRAVLLAGLLLRDGHRVHSFALEKAALPAEIPKDSCLQICVYGADCVILPVPAERGGFLTAPLSEEVAAMPKLIEALWPGQLLLGGGFSGESVRRAVQAELRVTDLLRQPAFVTANAAITAEAAIGLLLRQSERCLWRSRVLVLGWGRIGRLLALRLRGLGAQVTVAARGAADRAMAGALGFEALDYAALEGRIGDFLFLVNTVPARVLTEAMLCCVDPQALLLELASPPGGFDRVLADNIGLQTLAAPGLPGKCSPLAAAEQLREAFYAALKEEEE